MVWNWQPCCLRQRRFVLLWQHNLTREIVFCWPWSSSLREVSSHRASPGVGLCGPAGFCPGDGLAGSRSRDVVVCSLLLARVLRRGRSRA